MPAPHKPRRDDGPSFTPGPWEAEYGTDGYFYVTHDGGLENRRNPIADARLIASAPDMLEALTEAEKHFGPFAELTINGQHDPEDVRVVGLIRAALAKAGGQ